MRPSRHQMFMEIAHVVAKRATCQRLNVGAIIVHNRNILSIGYNGVPPGEPHCSGNDCPGRFRCELTTHAEENAIKHMAIRDTDRDLLTPIDLYTTDSPCMGCAALCQHVGIKRVFFAIPYRELAPLDFLLEVGIEVYRITPAGYVIDWRDKSLTEPWS
jgi:dCMP deaminase